MRGGTALTRAPRFKPKRDRHLKVIKVACPDCKSKPDVPCVRMDGKPSAGHLQHPARRRMAVRADNESRGI